MFKDSEIYNETEQQSHTRVSDNDLVLTKQRKP